MPPHVRDLMEDLQRAGFVDREGRGSHRNFVHPKVSKPIAISGRPVMTRSITRFAGYAALIVESRK